MPTPLYALRLPQKTQDDLVLMGKLYGLPNGRAFAREVLETMCSGDAGRVQAFLRRLMAGVGEQLALKLGEPLEAMKPASVAPARVARTARKKRRARARKRS
jgi:hypothetical protein